APAAPMWLTSALGGALHNLGQLAAAVVIARSAALWSYLPFLLLAGLICGTLTGGIAQLVSARLAKLLSSGKEAYKS
ncbi:MAG: Gx transporter family protein, partial [Pyramidobacter sp.]|nr:Gx transporter family protein [Pyramidobacter sp.]